MQKHPRNELRRRALCVALVLTMLFSSFPAAVLASSVQNVEVDAAPLTARSSATNGMVRVYLSSLGSPTSLDLTVVGNYSVSATGQFLSNGAKLNVSFNKNTGAITLTHNGATANMGTGFSLRRHSASGTNGIKIAQARESGNPYPGDITFKAVSSGSGYSLYTIANIYIEDYLYGVLPYEMGNSTSIEALKAQAVAARTYTVRMMQSRSSKLYDVVDTTSDQVYRGTPSGNANCVAAVNATKGIVLMYGSSYITTYYSASNGGQTELSRTGTNYPYMTVKDDPFDYANTSSTVKRTPVYADLSSSANNAQLMALLKSKAVTKLHSLGYNASQSNTALGVLQSVTPHTPKYASPSRLYTKMDFTFTVQTQNTAGNAVTTTVTVTCDIFGELESMLSMSIQSSANELWSVVKSGTAFRLEARRYGHGMGMSQRGAMYMAKLGYRYDQILGFYYEGCTRVQHSFTNTILSADSTDQLVTVEPPAGLDNADTSACQGTVRLVSSGATLAIRSEKSLSAPVIGTAGNGAIVEVLTNDGTWCFIRFGGLQGYVPANSLSISGTPSGSEGTATGVQGFATVTASDFVNLRAEGSMSAQVLTTAPGGAVLTVFSVSGSWAKVQYNAIVAYANTGFLSAVTQTYPSSTVSSGSSVATVATPDGAGTVNLRSSPSMDAQVLSQLAAGTDVTVLTDDGSWSYVNYQGMTGYLLSEYLSFAGDSLAPPDAGTPGQPAAPGADGDGNETPSENENATYATVTTEYGSLNMRASANAGSRILTTIPRLAQVEVTEYGTTWCGVRYGGYSGYAMTCFLTFANGDAPAPPQTGLTATVTTQSGTLNLRSQPRTGSSILLRIPQYAQISVTERGGEWCQATYQGVSGYVMTVFLTFSDDAPSGDTPAGPDGDGQEGDGSNSNTDNNNDSASNAGDDSSGDTGSNPGGDDAGSQPKDDGNSPDEPVVTAPDADDAVYATVTTVSGSLNLRRDAFPGSPVLTRIPKGTTIRIDEQMAAWSRTTYAGQSGYVMNAYLTFLTGKPETVAGQTAVVTTASGSLNMRLEPSLNAGVLARIPQYASVSVQKRGADWCYVSYNGLLGYVMTSFLTFENAGQSPQQPGEAGQPSELPPQQEQPSQQAQTAYVETVSGSLNLRETASASARVMKAIPRGAALEVLSRGTDWCQVTYGSLTGFVMTKFLRFDESSAANAGSVPNAPSAPSETPDKAPSEAPEEDETPDEATAITAWVLTDSGTLNLRSAPNGSEILTTVPRLAAVKLLEEGNEWSCVSYNGIRGYVMTKFLTVHQPSGALAAPVSNEAQASGEEAHTSAEERTETPDNGAASEPSQPATEEAEAEENETDETGEAELDITLAVPDAATFATPKEGELLLWSTCAERGTPLIQVPAGEQVEVVLKGETWCRVQYQNIQGYCLTRNLEGME